MMSPAVSTAAMPTEVKGDFMGVPFNGGPVAPEATVLSA